MNDPNDFTRDLGIAAAKATPPVVVSIGTTIGGMTLNEWVAVATIAYLVLQSVHLAWKWVREWRATRRAAVASTSPRTPQDE